MNVLNEHPHSPDSFDPRMHTPCSVQNYAVEQGVRQFRQQREFSKIRHSSRLIIFPDFH